MLCGVSGFIFGFVRGWPVGYRVLYYLEDFPPRDFVPQVANAFRDATIGAGLVYVVQLIRT